MIRQISGSNFLKFSPMIPGGGGNDFISICLLFCHMFFANMWCEVSSLFLQLRCLLVFLKEKKVNGRKALFLSIRYLAVVFLGEILSRTV